MAAAIAATTTTATAIFIISLIFCSTFSRACTPCGQSPPPATPPPATSTCPPPATPPSVTPPSPTTTCSTDILKLGVCTNLLGGIVGIIVGTPTSSNCCTLLSGLADLEAALCLCTAIKANVLGINLNVPVTLELIISACEKNIPPSFKCE